MNKCKDPSVAGILYESVCKEVSRESPKTRMISSLNKNSKFLSISLDVYNNIATFLDYTVDKYRHSIGNFFPEAQA